MRSKLRYVRTLGTATGAAIGTVSTALLLGAGVANADPQEPGGRTYSTYGPYSSVSACETARDNFGKGGTNVPYTKGGCYAHPSGMIDEYYFQVTFG